MNYMDPEYATETRQDIVNAYEHEMQFGRDFASLERIAVILQGSVAAIKSLSFDNRHPEAFQEEVLEGLENDLENVRFVQDQLLEIQL